MTINSEIIWFCQKFDKEITRENGHIINAEKAILYPSCEQCKQHNLNIKKTFCKE